MKGNELDELFRQKLAQSKLTPPSSAWEKVNGNLHAEKKHKGVIFWMKIAASILVIFVLSWVLLLNNTTPAESITPQTAAVTPKVEKVEVLPETTQPATTKLVAENKAEDQKEIKTDLVQSPSPKALVTANLQESDPDLASVITEPESFEFIETLDAPEMLRPVRVMVHRSQLQTLDVNPAMPFNPASFVEFMDPNDPEIKKKKFRMINGLISIAKGVNKKKIGLSGLRNAKNGFVNKELGYGKQTTEEEAISSVDDEDLNMPPYQE